MALDYLAYQSGPSVLEKAMSGYQFGAAQRQERELAAAKAEEVANQKAQFAQMQSDLAALSNNPAAGASDYSKMILKYPTMAEHIKKSFDLLTTDQQQVKQKQAIQFYSALQGGQVDVARKMLETNIEASENAGLQQDAQASRAMLSLLETSPETAKTSAGLLLAQTMGEKQFATVLDKLRAGPEKTFSVLSASESKVLGLPKGSYQRDDLTGKISAIGGGGTTINMPQIGSVPAGYKVDYDQRGRAISMTPIPGSPADIKAKQAAKQAGMAAESKEGQADIVLSDLGVLREMVENQSASNPVTGTLGAIVAKTGPLGAGSARKTAEGIRDTIVANIGFDKLQQMREESPTGGALGSITENELKFLQSVFGSINFEMDDKTLLRNIVRLEDMYGKIIKKAQAYPNAEKYGFSKPIEQETANVGGQQYSRPAGFTDEQWAQYKSAMGVK